MEATLGQVIYLLDTNAIIYHLRGAPELDGIFTEFAQGTAEPMISIITQIELLGFPRLTRQEEMRITALLANFRVRTVDVDIAQRAIALRRKYHLTIPDCIIAATSLAHDAHLVTRDEQLTRIRGLKRVNPFRSGL